MSIQSFLQKTAALLALSAAVLPALPQQPSPLGRSEGEGIVASPRSTAVATSVVLTISNPSTLFYGEEVGGYAVVSASDGTALSGTVTFFDGSANICTIPVTQTTSCPPSAGTGFNPGTHLLTAACSGDSAHLGSISNGVPVTVVPDVTTVDLASSASPANYGQIVVLTATAQGNHAVPSGQIDFFDGSNLIAIAALNQAGVATAATSALLLGTHLLTAKYAATTNFNAATSAVVNQVIQTAGAVATATTLASNINPAAPGQSVTFTADVSAMGESLVPAGTVTLLDGSIVLGTATLNSLGLGTFSTASLGGGSHNISANYSGNSVTAASSSTPLIETMSETSATGPGPFTLTIAGAPTVMAGSAVNLLLTVAPRIGSLQPVQLSCAGLPTESAAASARRPFPSMAAPQVCRSAPCFRIAANPRRPTLKMQGCPSPVPRLQVCCCCLYRVAPANR